MNSERFGLPKLRVIHQMARTGGTVICRCLASMDRVVLLSEIHPLGLKMFDPLQQAHSWYGLLTENDLQRVRRGPIEFQEAIALLARRCDESDRFLVIREWSHLDYTGVPFAQPVYFSRLVRSLAANFDMARFSTVRHPLDQWLSLSEKPAFRERLAPERFLQGALRFAEDAVSTDFIRFEDFTRDSDAALREICAGLDLEFDPNYRQRWSDYRNITGDVLPGRAGDEIRPLPRKPAAKGLAERFQRISAFRGICELLGYSD